MSPPPAPDPADERFVALVQDHRKILYKVAYAYCRDAEDRRDLVQEMVVQLWRSFARFDARVKFSTWMYRIAMNVAISHLRTEGRRIRDTVPLEDFALDIAAADHIAEHESDNMRELHRLIGAMDEMSRALILLYLDGHGPEEISAIVGITPGNVATRINRIKTRLQREFGTASNPREIRA
jgi:RNA polymerase sigma factor (sigma-70 family)